MTAFEWFVVGIVGWFTLAGAFILVMHAKFLMEKGMLTLFWKVHVLPWLAIGLVLDIGFNLIFGWIVFAESPLPRELTFSSRVQRHYRFSDGWRERVAVFWATQLNAIDPGHIRP